MRQHANLTTNKRKHRRSKDSIAEIVGALPRGIHLTAPEVYRKAKEYGLNVSLSTVYRTLHNLQTLGNVSTLAGERGLRYEAKSLDEDHDHLICLKCGFTIEFSDELIHGFGKSVAERKGFEHTASRFDIFGLCRDCYIKDESHKIEQAITNLQEAIQVTEDSTTLLKQALDCHQNRKFSKSKDIVRLAIEKLKATTHNLDESLGHFITGPVDGSTS